MQPRGVNWSRYVTKADVRVSEGSRQLRKIEVRYFERILGEVLVVQATVRIEVRSCSFNRKLIRPETQRHKVILGKTNPLAIAFPWDGESQVMWLCTV